MYEAAHARRIDTRSGEFRPLAKAARQQRRDVMSVSLDQDTIKELSNFVAVAFEVFLSAVDGLIADKASTEVGLKMANAGVEKYTVKGHDPNNVRGPGVHRPGYRASAGSVCPIYGQGIRNPRCRVTGQCDVCAGRQTS